MRMPFAVSPSINTLLLTALITLSILQACGRALPGQKPGVGIYIDEEFVSLAASFQENCRVKIKSMSLRWGTTRTLEEPDRVGYCIRKQLPTIRISRTAEEFPEYSLRVLVYHELGHCILGKDHIPEEGEIMSARFDASSDYKYRTQWNTLVNNFCGETR